MAESGYNYYDTSTSATSYGSYGAYSRVQVYNTGGGMSMAEYRKQQREKKLKRLVWL